MFIQCFTNYEGFVRFKEQGFCNVWFDKKSDGDIMLVIDTEKYELEAEITLYSKKYKVYKKKQ